MTHPGIPSSPLRDRVDYFNHVRFRGYAPVHFRSGLLPSCLRFAVYVTGHHARLGARLLARLCRGRHLRRLTSIRLQGATLTDPDLILSHHPARAIARRLPPSTERRAPPGEPVGPNQRRWPAPFAPRPLQPLQHYYKAVRPSPAHRYFRPRGWSRLRLFPWHHRPGSHVPYQSLVELRAAYTPDAARAVSGHLPS